MQMIPIFNINEVEPLPSGTHFDLLKPEQCDEILENFLSDKPVDAQIDKRVKDNRKRSTKVHPIPNTDKSKWIYELIADRVARYNQFGYKFNVSGMYSDLQLLEYGEGDHYGWHMDIGSGEAALRKISVVIQLTDPGDYEGGDLILNTGTEFTVPKDRGHIVVFPSYVLHQVTPVTKGTRYTLVGWVQGHDRFK